MTLTKIALALFLVLTLLCTACQRDGNDPTVAHTSTTQELVDEANYIDTNTGNTTSVKIKDSEAYLAHLFSRGELIL